MRVHVLKHVPFEGPAAIAEWALEREYELTDSLATSEEYPALDEFDFLVVMGGPMSAADRERNSWLTAEKRFVSEAMQARKFVLGVCLGAQIVAHAAGGSVRRNEYPEIGWYPVRRTASSAMDPLFAVFPEVLVVGHWHADTFDLPEGVSPVLSSDACANQAFTLDSGRVVGLQFHLEWTPDALEALVDSCMDELVDGGPYLTTAPVMLRGAERYLPGCRAALWMLLDLMVTLPEGRA